MTNIFNVDKKELLNAAVNAIVASVIIGLASVVTTPGFDVFHADWVAILHSMINWAFAGFIGSFGKSFMTTKEGNLLGMVKVK